MFGEEPEPEGDAAEARNELEAEVQGFVPGPQGGEGQRQKCGQNTHARHRACGQSRHVEETRGGSLGRGHDEQGQPSAARDAVDEADCVGPKAETKGMRVLMHGRRVRLVSMKVDVFLPFMSVRMSVQAKTSARRTDREKAEAYKHHRYDDLEPRGRGFSDVDLEGDDEAAESEKGSGVSQSPERADQRRAFPAFLGGDDGGNRHHVIGIERVADTEEEFRERYVSAFGAPNTSALLRQIPTYMILDDHEIEDNWVQGRINKSEKRNLFNFAIQAYLSYQWSHGPRAFGKQLYYSFDVAGFPFFVVDGRTQRLRDDEDYDLTDNHLLGRPGKGTEYKGQIDLLCEWLVKQQADKKNRPKFIVTASVFVPNDVSTTRSDRAKCADDSWAAFPNTRDQLLKTITDHAVQNVIFVSGDIHCSNIAEMSFRSKAKGKTGSKALSRLKAFSITSSAFYWPYPFADGDPLNYVHDSEKENDNFAISNGWEMRYKAWSFQQEDNYTQVDIDWANKRVVVRNFGKDGDVLNDATLALA